MTTPPPWRRLAPRSGAARLAALASLFVGLALVFGLIAAPLWGRLDDARERAARLNARAGALTAAAAAQRAEAGRAAPGADRLAAARDWLDAHAPARDPGQATLTLLSTLRLVAEAAKVDLTSAAPLEGSRAQSPLFKIADPAGLVATVAEARIVTDHQGLARFLAALESAAPPLRAAGLEITSRSAAATAEEKRLTARVIVGALGRKPAPDAGREAAN